MNPRDRDAHSPLNASAGRASRPSCPGFGLGLIEDGMSRQRYRRDPVFRVPLAWNVASRPGAVQGVVEDQRGDHSGRTTRYAAPCASVHYSMTWSARSSSDDGMVSPSAFAVLRLMTRSNFVGRSMGRSPAFTPLRILST
jgi:hypothetical protein